MIIQCTRRGKDAKEPKETIYLVKKYEDLL